MSDSSAYLIDMLRNLAMVSPVILVLLAGLILVLIRWKDLRGGAMPALLGLALGLILSVGSPVVWAVLPRKLAEQQATHQDYASYMATVFGVVHVITSLAWALAWGLVLAGLLGGRTQGAANTESEKAGAS